MKEVLKSWATWAAHIVSGLLRRYWRCPKYNIQLHRGQILTYKKGDNRLPNLVSVQWTKSIIFVTLLVPVNRPAKHHLGQLVVPDQIARGVYGLPSLHFLLHFLPLAGPSHSTDLATSTKWGTSRARPLEVQCGVELQNHWQGLPMKNTPSNQMVGWLLKSLTTGACQTSIPL